ncbi:alkaline phosphatase PhoX [Dactylosporangium sp. CA-139066]|uniref:alkaline phosphatase PhoX n=1 Tax=Dactylosporangium sp. CA-139066 TaxID=3239930 RepID=UPI003D9046ED
MEQAPPGPERAAAASEPAVIVFFEGGPAQAGELCRRALEEIEPDTVLAATLHLRRAWFSTHDAPQQCGSASPAPCATAPAALVTYFPHNPASESESGAAPKYTDMVFDGPDNVTVTPWGTLVLAEDGVKASHVLSSVPGGPTYAIARNQVNIAAAGAAPVYSEFTGPTFSADGKVLFVNIQDPGIMLAITGPWGKYLRG